MDFNSGTICSMINTNSFGNKGTLPCKAYSYLTGMTLNYAMELMILMTRLVSSYKIPATKCFLNDDYLTIVIS